MNHNPIDHNQPHESSIHPIDKKNYSQDDYKTEIEYIIQLIYEFDERSEKDCEGLGDTLANSIEILEGMNDQNYKEIIGSIEYGTDTDESMDEMLYEIEGYIDDICDKDEVIGYLNELKEALTVGWVSDKNTTKPHDPTTKKKRRKKNNK